MFNCIKGNRGSRRSITVCKLGDSRSEPFLFSTEPKHMGNYVQMYHVYRLVGKCNRTRSVTIISEADVCRDITVTNTVSASINRLN